MRHHLHTYNITQRSFTCQILLYVLHYLITKALWQLHNPVCKTKGRHTGSQCRVNFTEQCKHFPVGEGRHAAGNTCALFGWGEAGMGLVEVVEAKKKKREGDTIVGPLCSSGCRSQDEGGGWAAGRASPSPSLTVWASVPQSNRGKIRLNDEDLSSQHHPEPVDI